ncbi:MAG: MFS transporter [Syntrophomonadaceae bacterium]|nr:MFS transporter [Syntrophomonadaceae bacterium]MDD3889869.1 MFS transporter [Syntrophomonadaceae bacterium]MDD4549919.1 MFS transporter [Syntrophomonadaceae bacterium]
MAKIPEISEAAIKKTMSYRYIIYLIIALAYFFVYFHRVSPSVMAPELTSAFGIGASGLGLFSSMYFWAYALGQLPAGIMADRLGTRLTIAIFVGVAGVGAVVFGLAGGFSMALVGRFLVGLGVGFVYVPAMRFLADWFKSNEFATYSGILLGIGNVGALAAAAPLVVLMGAIGWRSSMTSVGILSIVIAVLCFLIIRDKPSDVGGASPAQIEGRPETKAATTFSTGEAIGMTVKSWNVWTIIVLFFIWYGTIMAFQGLWASPWLMNVYGMTKAEASKLITLIPIGMIIGCPLSGVIADKILKSKFKVVVMGAVGSIIVWIPLVFMIDSLSVGLISVLMFLFGYFNGHFVIMYANLKENVEPAIQGTATGFLNTFVFVGGALFQQITAGIVSKAPVVNDLVATSGFKSAFVFCLVTLVAALAVFMTQKRTANS